MVFIDGMNIEEQHGESKREWPPSSQLLGWGRREQWAARFARARDLGGGGGESSEHRDVGEEREVETWESQRVGLFEIGGCEKDGAGSFIISKRGLIWKIKKIVQYYKAMAKIDLKNNWMVKIAWNSQNYAHYRIWQFLKDVFYYYLNIHCFCFGGSARLSRDCILLSWEQFPFSNL